MKAFWCHNGIHFKFLDAIKASMQWKHFILLFYILLILVAKREGWVARQDSRGYKGKHNILASSTSFSLDRRLQCRFCRVSWADFARYWSPSNVDVTWSNGIGDGVNLPFAPGSSALDDGPALIHQMLWTTVPL